MNEVLGAIVAGVVGGLVIAIASRRRLRQRVAAAASGLPRSVPVKVRIEVSGLAGRWREGILEPTGTGPIFRPRRPRLGRRLDLSGLRPTGRRPARPSERWWFAGHSVLRYDGPLGEYELAAGSDGYLKLAEQLLGSRSA